MEKKDWYRRIQIASLLSLIPVILFTGPFSGYIVGNYLEREFGWPGFITIIWIGVGFLGSIIETIRIIRFVTRVDSTKK